MEFIFEGKLAGNYLTIYMFLRSKSAKNIEKGGFLNLLRVVSL